MRGLPLRPNRHERLRRAAVLKGKTRNPAEAQMRQWYLNKVRNNLRTRDNDARALRAKLGWSPLSEEQGQRNLDHNLGTLSIDAPGCERDYAPVVNPDRCQKSDT